MEEFAPMPGLAVELWRRPLLMQLEATAMEESGIIRVDDVAVRRIEVDSRSSGECMQAATGPPAINSFRGLSFGMVRAWLVASRLRPGLEAYGRRWKDIRRMRRRSATVIEGM